MRATLLSKLRSLPNKPGVYFFLGEKGKIIYVGKAKRLKKRVFSYFRKGGTRDERMRLLVERTRDIDFVVLPSEAKALIHEAGLIKDKRPKFNIVLKDDKSYPFLRLTIDEKYPRLLLTRRRMADGALYYGPYANVSLLRDALSFMKRIFPLRSCRRMGRKVCLEYHIGQCLGPCEKKVTLAEYGRLVGQLRMFLEGRKGEMLGSLKEEMRKYSASREYEKALAAKNRIEALEAVRSMRDEHFLPMFGELDELRSALGVEARLAVIECFDVSNIFGKSAVGSMVRFVDGRPHKAGYRRFRVKGVKGVDDYSMIRELVRRRYSRLLEEKGPLPGLVLVDGGLAHLSSAKAELVKLGLRRVPVAAIAKEFNHLYTEKSRRPVRLSPGSRLLSLIQRIRDEAHRFAIAYHRKLRSKEAGYVL